MNEEEIHKRKVGQRAKILFDDIDLKILETLNDSSDGLGVLQLVDIIQIPHNNLKPHIDRLLYLDLIFIYQNSEGKPVLFTGMKNFDNIKESLNDEEFQKGLGDITRHNTLLTYLRMSKAHLEDKKMMKLVDSDLRKNKIRTLYNKYHLYKGLPESLDRKIKEDK